MNTMQVAVGAGLVLSFLFTPLLADGKAVTFAGSYDWKDGGSDELSAEFKPAGENEWKVTFRFRWNNQRKSWKGRAKGTLDDGGTVEGTVKWSGRDWVFSARIEDGVMTGEHIEIQSGDERYPTGTFELKR